ncbi:unnamed protein product [Rotaria sordida]|uniref:Uncharacterized protein n=1 Tax=Rotaria sordida TaxID=392033 RepID=A0A814RJR0_9BILA|nr:unnamed protein product [Rotaria sordida]
MTLNLSRLKQLTITSRCELFPLFEIASNLEHLSIDFDYYSQLIDHESICQLSQKRLVHLEIFDIRNIQIIKFDIIFRQFKNLHHILLSTNDSSVVIDSLIIQALKISGKDQSTYVCINDSLSRDAIKIFRQWFLDHSHLPVEDSFAIDYLSHSTHLWI